MVGMPSWSYNQVDVPITLVAWERPHTLAVPTVATTGMVCTFVPPVVYSSTNTDLAVPATIAAAPSPTRTTARLVLVKAAPRAVGRRERRRRERWGGEGGRGGGGWGASAWGEGARAHQTFTWA